MKKITRNVAVNLDEVAAALISKMMPGTKKEVFTLKIILKGIDEPIIINYSNLEEAEEVFNKLID